MKRAEILANGIVVKAIAITGDGRPIRYRIANILANEANQSQVLRQAFFEKLIGYAGLATDQQDFEHEHRVHGGRSPFSGLASSGRQHSSSDSQKASKSTNRSILRHGSPAWSIQSYASETACMLQFMLNSLS